MKTCITCSKSHNRSHSAVMCRACMDKKIADNRRLTWIVKKAINGGVLLHPSKCLCADCGARAFCYDHRDYRKPLKVEAVCRTCNRRRGTAKPYDMKGVTDIRKNTITHDGKSQSLAEWAKSIGISHSVLHGRIHVLKWDHDRALTEPVAFRTPFSRLEKSVTFRARK